MGLRVFNKAIRERLGKARRFLKNSKQKNKNKNVLLLVWLLFFLVLRKTRKIHLHEKYETRYTPKHI